MSFPTSARSGHRRMDALAVAALLTLMAWMCLNSMVRKCATYDEVPHVAAGFTYLAKRDFRMNTEHPAGIKLLSGAAVSLLKPGIPQRAMAFWDQGDRWAQWHFGWHFLYSDPGDVPPSRADTLLVAARSPIVLLGLILAACVYSWARQLYGPRCGLFALCLCVFSPNILAHSRLVTTDLGITAFWFASMYGVFRLSRKPGLARVFPAGLLLGCCLATKFSALLMFSWLAALMVLWVLAGADGAASLPTAKPAGVRGRTVMALAAVALMALLAVAVLWGCYGFRFSASPGGVLLPATLWEESLPDSGPARAAIQWSREHRILPEAYLHGLSTVFSMRKGRISFLNGEINRTGWWRYFPVAFAYKTPVAMLLLVVLRAIGLGRRSGLSVRSPELYLVLPVVFIMLFAIQSRLNIGHRHILPVYPFLFVLVSPAVEALWVRSAWLRVSAGLLLAWYVAASLFIFPDYLAYFNELAGGPGNGYKRLLDSNLDWGQDLKQLRSFMDANGIDSVKLSYFGQAPPAYYGIQADLLPCYRLRQDQPPLNPRWLERDGVFAVSANMYEGLFNDLIFTADEAGEPVTLPRDFVKNIIGRDRKPDAFVGYSILIFDFR